jgi:hypothetical protein
VVDFERGTCVSDVMIAVKLAPVLLSFLRTSSKEASKQHGPPPSHGAEQVAWYRMYDLVWYGMAW